MIPIKLEYREDSPLGVMQKQIDILQAKLDIAVEALGYISRSAPLPKCDWENVRAAQEALKKLDG